MYRGVNPTALQSQQWLSESLMELMKEKPFARITVQDICRQADLSRQTFYNFFASKEEILHFYLQQKYEEQFQKYCEKQTITMEEIIEAFSCVMVENKDVIAAMLENNLEGVLSEEMSNCIALFAGRFVSPEKDNELLPYSEVLLSGAFAALLIYWFKQEKPISIRELAGLLQDFFAGHLYEVRTPA